MPFQLQLNVVSPALQFASIFNEGVWDKESHGLDWRCVVPWNGTQCVVRHACYPDRGKSLQCAGYIVIPLLVMPHWMSGPVHFARHHAHRNPGGDIYIVGRKLSFSPYIPKCV